MSIKITESRYDELYDEFNIWFSESGCDREHHSDSDVETMLYQYVSDELGADEWEVV